MNNYLIILGISVLLLTTGLSGCTVKHEESKEEFTTLSDGTKVYGDIDKVEILNYSIVTEQEINDTGWHYSNTYKKIADGFVYSENASRYRVNVTIKNIDGEPLDTIRIDVKYYDNLNNLLRYSHECKYDLYMGDATEVSFTWYNDSYGYHHPYFKYVDHIGGFEISAS